jgi:carbamoyl-phosphate synthase large subunit
VKRVLVTGAGGPASTNFIRSLRLAPEPFHIVGTDANAIHLALSQADVNYELPTVRDSEYLARLNSVIEQEGINFVHAQPDVEVHFLSEHRSEVRAPMLLPGRDTIRLCADKQALAERLSSAGVPTGQTHPVADEAALSEAVNTLLASHARVWVRARRGAGGKASLPVTSAEQAVMWVRYWNANGVPIGDFMAGEFLPGREFAFQSIWQNGELVTSQARERKEYLFGYLTPSGQTSSPAVARTVHRQDVNETATAAIKAADPDATGIFCVDLKENTAGVPCVTEINAGRFFTTSIFFSQAGCNMPYFYTLMGYGEAPPKLARWDALPEGLYWVRLMDMGDRLLREGEWKHDPA